MTELADVFNQFAGDYLDRFGDKMPPSHHQAIQDIIACRTPVLGGNLYQCESCGKEVYAYRSCSNRHCPKCHTKQTNIWLEARQEEMLPVDYFHITITIPECLRPIFRQNQRDCYAALMQGGAAAIIELAADPKYCGGTVGVLSVLHTWTGQLIYHPHGHFLVTGGGVSKDGETWMPSRQNFLIPVRALSTLVRGKIMAQLKKRRPDLSLPQAAWDKPWVAHCKPWGKGEQAIINYLGRYAFRIAITNARILAMDDQTVRFRHKDRKKGKWEINRLSGEEFMRRFLQHVLPRGFHKIRYSGLWHFSKRDIVQRIRLLLLLDQPATINLTAIQKSEVISEDSLPVQHRCPHCGKQSLVLRAILAPARAQAP
jgi:predicted RNA-binding Zn-ribbon protein involved in translation (DUF1610 family)